MMLALQVVAGPPVPVPPKPRTTTPARCAPWEAGDIVVCARPNDDFRLKPLPDRYVPERATPRAEMTVFGDSKLSLDAEQGADAQGGAINRAMVRLKIPLGGKRR